MQRLDRLASIAKLKGHILLAIEIHNDTILDRAMFQFVYQDLRKSGWEPKREDCRDDIDFNYTIKSWRKRGKWYSSLYGYLNLGMASEIQIFRKM